MIIKTYLKLHKSASTQPGRGEDVCFKDYLLVIQSTLEDLTESSYLFIFLEQTP